MTAQSPATAPAANKPATSAEEELVSVDKQRASIRLQVGEGGEADSFFTTPWSTPRAIPLPLTCDPMPEEDIVPLVKNAAAAQDLSAILIRSVIRRESASLWCAVSEKGAIGLMQLMPDTAKQFGVDPYDPKQNVQAGSKYLKQLMTRYKDDTSLALAAYNAGPTVVDAAGGIPKIPETAAYVAAILKDVASRVPALPVVPKPE
jgi:soluble lytic murein transglycosylase-like protein